MSLWASLCGPFSSPLLLELWTGLRDAADRLSGALHNHSPDYGFLLELNVDIDRNDFLSNG